MLFHADLKVINLPHSTDSHARAIPISTTSQTSSPKPPLTAAHLLAGVFAALFVQIQAVLFYSFISYKPAIFVERFIPQIDLSDFVIATSDWLRHLNPYLRPRFDKPPATLLIGLPFQHMTPAHAALLFFFANLAIVAALLAATARCFKLNRPETLLLFSIASAYWPTMFLIERGNLDGIMLALMLLAIFSRNQYVQALSLAFSIGLKAYSALLFAPLLATRAWKRALLAIACLVVILLPFHALLMPFIHSQTARTSDLQLTENLSPAVLVAVFSNTRAVRLGYALFWLALYLAMASRYRNAPVATQMVYSLPWMIAFPLEVYPYTGILLLPVLIQRTREIASANRITLRDSVFLTGFLLVGFQQTAWLAYFRQYAFARIVCATANPLGTLLILSALALGGPLARTEVELQKEQPTAAPSPRIGVV